jgi:hypothetical protein
MLLQPVLLWLLAVSCDSQASCRHIWAGAWFSAAAHVFTVAVCVSREFCWGCHAYSSVAASSLHTTILPFVRTWSGACRLHQWRSE